MPRRRTGVIDHEIEPLLKHAAAHDNQWIPFAILNDTAVYRTIRWFVYSKHSPFGWSPAGDTVTASHSFDLMWLCPDGHWSRDIKTKGVHRDGLRIGRVKIMTKRSART